MRKSLKQFAIITSLTVAATIGISSPALADGTTRYQNRWNQACLDSNSAGDAYTLGCNTGDNQKWNYQFISGTSWYLKNMATKRCLDANSANSVYTNSCNGGVNQRWRRLDNGQWINVKTGKCLAATVYSPARHAVFTAVCVESDDTLKWSKV